jgi:hypothetical protein
MDDHVGADAGVSEMAAQRVSGMACIEKRTGVLQYAGEKSHDR